MTSSKAMAEKTQSDADGLTDLPNSRITALEIARRLNIGRLAVYSMLEQGIIPGVRLGRRWIVTRHAY
jgi:excisionase family DNA binding protein